MALVDPALRALYDLKVSGVHMQSLVSTYFIVVVSRFSSNVIPT